MIKFGIPSMDSVVDRFPGQDVLTLNALEKDNSKRKFTLSKHAAEQLGVQPGLSKVAFSFDGGNFIAVIPDGKEGIAEIDKMPVNKELSFISKKAYDYMCTRFSLNSETDNHLQITSIVDNYGMKVGTFSTTPMEQNETPVANAATNDEVF